LAGASRLKALADRDRRLQYDPGNHAAKIDVPLSFDDKGGALSAASKRQLDELARLLKSEDARELRVMIAGSAGSRLKTTGDASFGSARQWSTARAQAVADYLDRHGIAQERLAVTGTGSRTGASSDSGDGGVEIYLMDETATVVGWSANKAARR
jgi:outer membrane protein OmpA-like peptidoglycan-associated protein